MLAAGSESSSNDATDRSTGKKSASATEVRRAKAASSTRLSGLAVGREVFRIEGVRGLFRGGALRGAWTALGSGLYLGIYESSRAYLERRRQGDSPGPSVI